MVRHTKKFLLKILNSNIQGAQIESLNFDHEQGVKIGFRP